MSQQKPQEILLSRSSLRLSGSNSIIALYWPSLQTSGWRFAEASDSASTAAETQRADARPTLRCCTARITWTRKVAGKTVNATLTPEQAARFKGGVIPTFVRWGCIWRSINVWVLRLLGGQPRVSTHRQSSFQTGFLWLLVFRLLQDGVISLEVKVY